MRLPMRPSKKSKIKSCVYREGRRGVGERQVVRAVREDFEGGGEEEGEEAVTLLFEDVQYMYKNRGFI